MPLVHEQACKDALRVSLFAAQEQPQQASYAAFLAHGTLYQILFPIHTGVHWLYYIIKSEQRIDIPPSHLFSATLTVPNDYFLVSVSRRDHITLIIFPFNNV